VCHRVIGLTEFAQRLLDASADIDEGEITKLPRGLLETSGQLRSQFEGEQRVLRGELLEARSWPDVSSRPRGSFVISPSSMSADASSKRCANSVRPMTR